MRGFGNLMFPSWFILLGGSFVFLDVGPPILFLAFPPFLGCFGLFMIWQGFVNTLVYQLKHKLYTISQSLCSYHLPMPKIETKSFGNKSFMQPMRRLNKHLWGAYIFSFRGKGGVDLFFLGNLVPNVFSSCSQKESSSSKVVPQDIPNSPSDLSHTVCPKFNSHVYKLKR